MYCEPVPVPLNGQVTYNNSSQSTAFNSLVTYTCKVGFELSGMATRQCNATGQWSGRTPSCTGKLSIKSTCLQLQIEHICSIDIL